MKKYLDKITVPNLIYTMGFGSYALGLLYVLKYGIIYLEPVTRSFANPGWLYIGFVYIGFGLILTFATQKHKTLHLFGQVFQKNN